MNTGGPASEKTLLDEFAGQALAGLCASPETQMPFDVVHRLAYDHAEAMLAEKARREAEVEPTTSGASFSSMELSEVDRLKMQITRLEALNKSMLDGWNDLVELLEEDIREQGFDTHPTTEMAISNMKAAIAKSKEVES